jgi:hypothetical protein|tara:strand:- start:574 stop:939 length:366 start_codon:yes stop_codon:yes gene_type:complete
MSDKDLYGKEDFLHKGTSHIMDSKSPGRVPKYYHGKEINRKNQFLGGGRRANDAGPRTDGGGSYHEIKHQKNPEAGTSKGQSPFSRGNKEARQRGTLLTRGGGKGGWIRKLVNSITGNPLE